MAATAQPLLPFDVWPSGITQASVPANDNALRAEVIGKAVLSFESSQPVSPSNGDLHILSAAWGDEVEGTLALYSSDTWSYWVPYEGLAKWVSDSSRWVRYDSGWVAASEVGTVNIYVATTGDDDNSGLTSLDPYLTIQKAIDVFRAYGERGEWTINVAAGTYSENLDIPSLTPMEYPLDIRGPSVGGTPNVPTVIIDAASAISPVVQVRDGTWLRMYDVKVQDATSSAGVNANGKCRITLDNVHISNCLNGVIAQHGAFAAFSGGIWNGNTIASGIGFRSLYNATHDHQPAGLSTATLIEDYITGAQIQEGGQGHIDFLKIHDCTNGIILRRGCGAVNTSNMQIYRCGVGLTAQGSPWFNNGIDFGTGGDACTVNVKATGGAPEFDFRSQDYDTRTRRLQESVYGTSHTGTTSATIVYEFDDIRTWMVSEGGHSTEVVATVSNAALAGTASIQFFVWDGTTEDLLSGVVLPVGTTSAQVRGLISFSAVGSQRCSVSAIHNAGALCGSHGTGALNLKNLTSSIRMKVTLSNSGDTITFQTIEFHTTLGG